MPDRAARARLSWAQIGSYAVPVVGVNFMENLINFYLLKFATDVLLVAPGWMGLWFGLSRVWDAVSDPVVGYWSDGTRSRFGRRRPWFAAAALPLGLLFLALWSPPAALPPAALAWWMGIGVVLFFTAQTAFAVPHLALGAELSSDSHERTRVFAGRLGLGLFGVLLAAMALGALERGAAPRATATGVAALASAPTLGFALFAVSRLRERPEYQGRGARSPYAAFGDVLRNPHARLLIAVLFLEALGFACMTASMAFANEYVYDLAGMTSVMLGGAMVVMLVTVPLWLWLARRYGRHRLWVASLAVRAVAFAGMLVVQPGQWVPVAVNMIVIGATFGCGSMLGPSLKADVIDDDERRTGQRKEGTFFASWNLAQKSALGVAIMLSGFVLELAGFEPNAVQSESARAGIRALFAGLPCGFYALAALLLLRFRLEADLRAPSEAESPPAARPARSEPQVSEVRSPAAAAPRRPAAASPPRVC